ncbi:MAG: hypothetical protein ABSE55_15705, partial [Terracidiphilus sp.]
TENSKLAPARHQKNNRLPENLNRNTPLSRNRGRSHADTLARDHFVAFTARLKSCPFKTLGLSAALKAQTLQDTAMGWTYFGRSALTDPCLISP